MSAAELAAMAAIVPGSPQAWQGFEGDKTAKQALAPLLGVTIAMLIINTAFIVLRFTTTLFLRHKSYKFGWDDWLLIPAWVSTTALCGVVLGIYHQETIGDGPAHRPIFDYRLVPLLKSTYAGVQFLLPGYLFTRLSILFLFLRIFRSKWVRWVTYFTMAFVCCQYVAFMIACFLQCLPIEFFWNKMLPSGGHCVSINKFYRSFTPPNIFVDIILICTPLPTVWRLNASKGRRLGYTIVFFTGFIALIASIIRQYELVANTNEALYPTVSNVIISWLVLEPSLYLVTACLPGMVPLLAICLPTTLRQKANAHKGHARHTSSRRLRENGDGAFTRLVDEPHTTSGRAEHVKNPAVSTGGRSGSGVENVEMDDLRKFTEGGGIMVTTEISVTQEERFAEVLGF